MLRKTFALVGTAALLLVLLAACRSSVQRPSVLRSSALQLAAPKPGDTIATITTDRGTIKAVLFPDAAPKAVENFVALAKDGYYDGVLFHRVVEDFLIQSGDPTGTGTGGQSVWGASFACEYPPQLHNYSGALAMVSDANGQNNSQFYIVTTRPDSVSQKLAQKLLAAGFDREVVSTYREVGGAPYLDCKSTVFGQIYSGMEIADEIDAAATVAERPKKEIHIQSITVETYADAGTAAG